MGLYPLKSQYAEREGGGRRKSSFNENFARKKSPESDESNVSFHTENHDNFM